MARTLVCCVCVPLCVRAFQWIGHLLWAWARDQQRWLSLVAAAQINARRCPQPAYFFFAGRGRCTLRDQRGWRGSGGGRAVKRALEWQAIRHAPLD